MPYILTRSDGSTLATIQDASLDKSTDLVFVGRNYAGYGQVVNENLVKILENFANTSPPKSPIKGELWYDTANKKLKIFNGSVYQSLALVNATSITKPTDQTTGDLFWDQQDQKLYIFNGTQHVLIGPPFSQNTPNTNWGAGTMLGAPPNNSSQVGPYTTLKANVNANVTSIVSADEFVVNIGDGLYNLYSNIKPGVNVPTAGLDAMGFTWPALSTLPSGTRGFWGLGAVSLGMAQYLGLSNGVPRWQYNPESEYVKQSDIGNLYKVHLTHTDSELSIGSPFVSRLHVTGRNANPSGYGVAAFSNINPSNPRLELNVTLTGSTSLTNILAIDGASTLSVLPGADNQVVLGNSSYRWSNVTSVAVTSAYLNAGADQTAPGTITGQWTLGPGSTINIGQGSVSASSAQNSTNANHLQNYNNTAYLHTSTDGSLNSIPQLDNSGYLTAGGITAVNAGSVVTGAWTLAGGGTFQASALMGVDGVNFYGADTVGSYNSIAQRTSDGSLKASSFIGTTVQVGYINAGSTNGAVGHISGQWQLQGTSTLQATYSDIAERYEADQPYEPGTVVIVGGSKEITTTNIIGNVAVAGIVSTDPAFKMNSDAGDDLTHPYIALKGRVPCKVVGKIAKGDLLVTSSYPGYAQAYTYEHNPNAVIGRALESHDDGFGVIEVKV